MFQRYLFVIEHTNTTTTSDNNNITQIITVTDSAAIDYLHYVH